MFRPVCNRSQSNLKLVLTYALACQSYNMLPRKKKETHRKMYSNNITTMFLVNWSKFCSATWPSNVFVYEKWAASDYSTRVAFSFYSSVFRQFSTPTMNVVRKNTKAWQVSECLASNVKCRHIRCQRLCNTQYTVISTHLKDCLNPEHEPFY